jgi:hypothetical protein
MSTCGSAHPVGHQQKKLKKLDDPVKDDILLANATEWPAIIARRQSLWEMPVQHGEASFP